MFGKFILSLLNSVASFYLFILFYLVNQNIEIFSFHTLIQNYPISDNVNFIINVIIYIIFGLIFSWILLLFGSSETMSTSELSTLEPSYIPTYIGFFVIALSLGKDLSNNQLFFIGSILFFAWWKLGKTAYFNMFLLALGYQFYQVKESNSGSEMILISREKDKKNQLNSSSVRRINNFTFVTK